ncbi:MULTISPECIES: tyrosine-type recombinase/integrase [unclassified Bradyrhizobium]|uniref:tyrosine-type recombinase/integrase n=1 Tax=Bradyrhizobium sp. USDA 4541 TaxID=2817704 RepID=UPI0020A3B316|nr:site-specific integrase [Bradyrhizobium sp. USDA 4541]MCP1851213.1 integrase [Bradyrhizobium sp. USDA 4541]
MKVDLKGIKKAKSKGKIYYYAWRGGPRLTGQPGTPEFIASYNEAIESRKAVSTDRFSSVVVQYKASGDYKKLADSTKSNWSPWLDRISLYFGDLRIAQFDRPEKIRPIIRRWRNQWTDKPRTADYGMQVLSRVLSYAVDPLAKIASNPCEGIKQLYTADRSEIIWTDADIIQLKAKCSPEIALAVDLAAHTGLRQGDLLRLSWSHIRQNHIEITTGKSKHRRTAYIPLYDDLRAVLARIPKVSTTVLTSSHRRPWAGFGSAFDRAKKAAGMGELDLHFHDLRGTAVTKLYIANLPIRVIAEIVAWEEKQVEKIIRRYVGREAATRALIEQINAARRGDEKRT